MSSRSSTSSSPSVSSSRRKAFFRLPAVERRLILGAAAVLPLVIVAVRVFGLSAMLNLLMRVSTRRDDRVATPRIGALVHATANRFPVHTSCLERSVAVTWLLRRRCRPCALVIESPFPQFQGSKIPTFEAHAWVDTPDGPIGARDPGATELARWPLAAPHAL